MSEWTHPLPFTRCQDNYFHVSLTIASLDLYISIFNECALMCIECETEVRSLEVKKDNFALITYTF
jgi:hypothetical protein